MADLDVSVRVPLTTLDDLGRNAVQRLRLVASGQRQDPLTTKLLAQQLERAIEADRQRRAALMLEPAPGAAPGDFAAFHNRLRIMIGLERHDLVAAGVMETDDLIGWVSFQHDPFRWFIRAEAGIAQALWGLICKREGRAS